MTNVNFRVPKMSENNVSELWSWHDVNKKKGWVLIWNQIYVFNSQNKFETFLLILLKIDKKHRKINPEQRMFIIHF
jgi:hypothetical protein